MRKWWPLAAVCAGAFMLLVDVTIVNVALPDMARELHTTFGDLQWVIDLYALVLGALVLTVGSIADRVGRRGSTSSAWWSSPPPRWPVVSPGTWAC